MKIRVKILSGEEHIFEVSISTPVFFYKNHVNLHVILIQLLMPCFIRRYYRQTQCYR
jgi:hypothetical protein